MAIQTPQPPTASGRGIEEMRSGCSGWRVRAASATGVNACPDPLVGEIETEGLRHHRPGPTPRIPLEFADAAFR